MRKIIFLAILFFAVTAHANTAESKSGMVVTVHPIATDAGVRVMSEGGNAVDAAVAAALMLGVVDGHNSGIGGGCFMLIRTADGRTIALEGREMAPAAATRDMFVRDGKADTSLSQNGPLASGVPGSVAVYEHAVKNFGKRPLRDLFLPAADVAERGFGISENYAAKLKGSAREIARFPESARILLKPDGNALEKGDTLKQPDLAKTYRALAEQGDEYFYRGPFAHAVAKWMAENGGIITAADFANYQMKQREPLVTKYRGRTIIGFPPPSSGGIHVAQVLNILELFDVGALDKKRPADRIHITAEAMKLAFADRAYWLGDSDFVPVPRGLLEPFYAKTLADKISMTKALANVDHGTPPYPQFDVFGAGAGGKHTTHIAAADAEGNWVGITTTVNTSFGSKVIVPGTGVILNNQMDDFSIQPGTPNAFKLIGSDANAIAPGKRPLSSMSPTIVLDEKAKPIMTLGAAGGPTIITQVLCVLTAYIDLGDDLPAAMARPRFHHQWSPATLRIEETVDPAVLKDLKSRGHELVVTKPGGATNAIMRKPDGTFVGVSEPRQDGKSAGPPTAGP
ncbi:MAG: gamma-glutamyltranspeptidase / glutathione hydrolase [Phycisphaerales bacterium]|jgi:gamma-glutamyltranspeptidase/glutathione hydrolase|nr:gamma-glutamyltranspeptidase / glutathione hydrolase [Phycisphaerales bacterium]